MPIIQKDLTKILFFLATILVVLFVLFALTSMDSEQDESLTSATLPNSGTIPHSSSTHITGTFVDSDLLFVFFQGMDNRIYFSYAKIAHERAQWSDPTPLNLTSIYGVDAVAFQNPQTEEKSACLFIKNSAYRGDIEYSCSPIRYNPLAKPMFSFQPPSILKIPRVGLPIDGLTSIAQLTANPNQFYVVLNEFFYDNGVDPTAFKIRRLKCEMGRLNDPEVAEVYDSRDPNLLNKICRVSPRSTLRKMRSFEPSLVTIPKPEGLNDFFTFFSDSAPPYEGLIYYTLQDARNFAMLSNNKSSQEDAIRYTKKRTSAYFLDNDSGSNVFVAYKNSNDSVIRFSRISHDNLLSTQNGYPGFGLWTHCELKKQTDSASPWEYIAHSSTGPTVFEYDKKLYLLYSDANNGNQLTYQRIDDITADSGACTGN